MQVRETHLLILIPKTINGEALTLNSLRKLIKSPKKGFESKFAHNWGNTDEVLKKFGDIPINESYWALITKDVVPNSRCLTFGAQEKLLTESYRVPKLIEIAVCVFLYRVREGDFLYHRTSYEKTNFEDVKIN